MTALSLYAVVSAALLAICMHCLLTRAELLRKLLALNMMGSAVFLLLVAIADHHGGGDEPDPVPHAMVLTGIVIAVSATAFALALLRRHHDATGSTDLDEAPPDA